ncbi:MAG: hypothetical protein IKB86_05675 [Clostridia bacterium]|nr:hypothetical protein [Clostridia bacterium]
MVNGNLKGIKEHLRKRIEALDGLKTDASKFLPLELAQEMGEITSALGKELCIYIARNGEILYVDLGEDDRASLKGISLRRSSSRLSGIRCIHTHPGGNGHLSSVDIESLKKLRFDAMCAIGVDDSGTTNASVAILSDNDQGYNYYTAPSVNKIPQDFLMNEIFDADKTIKHETIVEQETEKERVMLIGTDASSVEELERLTDTAGGETVYKAIQKGAKGIIGKGKISELALVVQSKNIELAVYDDELTGSGNYTGPAPTHQPEKRQPVRRHALPLWASWGTPRNPSPEPCPPNGQRNDRRTPYPPRRWRTGKRVPES